MITSVYTGHGKNIHTYTYTMMIVHPLEAPPHIRTARASPQQHTAAAAGTAAPTTADTERTQSHSAPQPHSNGLCSPPEGGPRPRGSALRRHVDAGPST